MGSAPTVIAHYGVHYDSRGWISVYNFESTNTPDILDTFCEKNMFQLVWVWVSTRSNLWEYALNNLHLFHLGPPTWQLYQIHLVLNPIVRPQNGRCIRYTCFSIPCSDPKMAGVSDTPGFKFHLQAPKWQVYQIHLVLNPIFRPQSGRCIRYTCFSIPFCHPKMAGVSDTPGFKCHLQAPKWQVYQIHLVLNPFSGPKVAGVSDTPAFLSHFVTPKWQVYQIHLIFYPILSPQSGRCIRYTCFSIPFCHPEMASVSDTIGF